ncbi:MAG: SDR family NAD(P)-dependent oxidoreductase, partial [Acidobacteria bacterium]|nr:SDR family NAD(P)-dependent oxidoreductase [Acidobacteriota bacterium]
MKDEHRLLRDLHLNSISVGQLVAEAARQLHLPPPLAPTEYADASVFEIARALESFRAGGMSAAQATEPIPAGVDAWVRAFVVTRVETPLPAPRRKPQGRGHWRVFAPAEHPLAPILSQRLEEWGDTGILVCLPPQPDESHLKGLLDAAQAALGQEGAPCYFVLVQHEGVAASFARTLHQEAKGLTTCVVDVPLEERACAWVMAEIQAAEGFHEAYYDAEGRRSAICLRLLSEGETQETIPMGPADVLLVSGGGKGIAAECALALARESGVRLMLLGRSRPEEDEALASNLARLAAAGVRFRYQRADVTEAPSVRAAVVQGEQELGPVTAILHGAGVNRPQALRQLTEAAISATLAPKLQGLRNLLAAVEPTRLRLLVTFSSIIGRTGMQGEADYALANAWLTRMTEAFQAEHPACRCLALEWSIWSGVGMGERLGRVDALLRAGITPISVDAGVGWLRHLIACPPATTAVVISGRLGATPPLKLEGRDLPFLRFLEQPQVHYPGVELVVDAELSRTSDPYLEDHVFKGEQLFPAVMGLEAMAQVALAVLGETSAPGFENVEFAHPIAVGAGARITLRIAALARAPTRVDVVLGSSETAFQVDHFRATCRFGRSAHPPRHASRPIAKAHEMHLDYLALDPHRHLYGELLFQSGRFRRLRAYRDLAATRCCADIDTDNVPWFGRYLPEDTVLGDPGSRDAAIHAIQACIPHALLLPVGVERLIPGMLHAPGPWTVTARERWQQGDVFCYDLELYG